MVVIPESVKRIAVWNASSVTTELEGSLVCALRSIAKDPRDIITVKGFERNRDDILYIIICPAGLGSEKKQETPKYYICYQLEPTFILTKEDRAPYRDMLAGALDNWDYSRVNVEALKSEARINIRYVSPGYTDALSTQELVNRSYIYNDTGKDIDVLFLGWDVWPRRAAIKTALMKERMRIWFVTGLDSEGMKKAIRRAKVCLNMHSHDDMPCFETVRMSFMLANQACIVSEDSIDPEFEIYKEAAHIVPYDKLVAACVEHVKNPELRYNQAMKGYKWHREECEWNKTADFKTLLSSSIFS